ncbi:MAG: hypothetical protein MUC42_09600 [Bryobacter sp.]|jgi:hypothetical protein|nr:hypothetical protein [Bryobacter sp.]
MKQDRLVPLLLLLNTLLFALLLLRPAATVQAEGERFAHLQMVATQFLYKGDQGLLVLDKRNGNVWFYPNRNFKFEDPVLVIRIPFEKLDGR